MRIFDTNVQEIKYQVLKEVVKLANKDKLNDVLSLAKRNRGEIPVLLYFEDEKITKRTDMEYWVRDTYELSENLKRILGEENVKYVSKSWQILVFVLRWKSYGGVE